MVRRACWPATEPRSSFTRRGTISRLIPRATRAVLRPAASFADPEVDIADFSLERYFARWEFAVRYNLCASDPESMSMVELLSLADDDAQSRWGELRLGYTESLGLPALREEI